MGQMTKEISVKTSEKLELVDVTEKVADFVAESKVKNGICLVFIPHDTCGLVLNENEENLKEDFKKVISSLSQLGDLTGGFSHDKLDSNAVSHLSASIFGQEKLLAVEKGNLVLGIWQKIMLFELDGPRTRRVVVKIIGN